MPKFISLVNPCSVGKLLSGEIELPPNQRALVNDGDSGSATVLMAGQRQDRVTG